MIVQLGEIAGVFCIAVLSISVFDNLSYAAATFKWGSDVDLVLKYAGLLIDEMSMDLSDFKARDGRLIVPQG